MMQDRMHRCIAASRHLVIAESGKNIYLVGVRLHELWKIDNEFLYYVECGFLVIESFGQMHVVEAKNAYLVDEYTKFGSVGALELLEKVREAEIDEEFEIAYRRMRGV
jgi:hypothetical protein